MRKQRGRIILPSGVAPWPHEMRVARILSNAGHKVEFIHKVNIKSADIFLDGVEFEIKSPKTNKANSLEHVLKKALKQSVNIIVDSSRIREIGDMRIQSFLTHQVQSRRRIKRMLLVTKAGDIVDIK